MCFSTHHAKLGILKHFVIHILRYENVSGIGPTHISAQSNEYEIVKKSGKLIIYTLAIAQEKEQTNAPIYMTKKVISLKQMTEISNSLMKH